SRSHARRAWETAQVAHKEDEKMRAVKSEVEKIEQTRAMATSITTPINLPPSEIQTATSQIQRKLSDEAANAPQPVSKANEIKDDRKLNESIQPTMTVTASIEFGSTNHTEEVKDSSRSSHPVLAQSGALTQTSPTAFPLNRSAEDWNTSDEQSTDSDNRTGIVSKGVSREFVNHSSIRSDLESFDSVQMQNAS